MRRDGGQSRRELRPVNLPVAKRSLVVIPTFEPAVVENKPFDTQNCGLIDKFDDGGLIDVKITRFPGVELNRASPVG